MDRLPRLLALGLLALQGWWLSLPLRAQTPNPTAFASDPADAAVMPGPIYIFEDGPLDLDAIRKRLAQPDLVILRGGEYDRLRNTGTGAAAPRTGPPRFVLDTVRIGGTVQGSVARLKIQVGVTLGDSGFCWVPVRLDGQPLSAAREEHGSDLPVRSDPAGGWEVRLEGKGRHELILETITAVRSEPTGDRLELALPSVASTRIDLGVPGRVNEAESAPGQPIEVVPEDQGRTARLQGSLSARERITLYWRTAQEAGQGDAPLLSAQGEIALDVNRAMIQTRSTWSVQCERGSSRAISFQLSDPTEEPVTAEVEDQSVPIAVSEMSGTRQLTIALPVPIQPGERRRLTLTTRRKLPSGATARLTFRGFPVNAAVSQSGMIGIVQGPDLWVSGTAGRGLRQVDPRELTDTLRSRPSTVLAYHFVDQPFELELRVDPSPPMAVVDARTSMRIAASLARVETELSYRVERGRFQEVRLGLPPGSVLNEIGPRSVVESYQILDQAEPTDGGTRPIAVIRLNSREVAKGQFRVHLVYSEATTTVGDVDIRLPKPLNVLLRSGYLTVSVGRDLAVELAPIAAGIFSVAEPESTVDGSDLDSSRDPATGVAPALWLSYDTGPDHVPLRLTPRSRALRHENRLRARIERAGVEIRQAMTIRVRNGSLQDIELIIPPSLEGHWELDSQAMNTHGARVVNLSRAPGATRDEIRYRLVLDREVTDRLTLAFRGQLQPESWGTAGQSRRLELSWIRPVEGSAAPVRVEVGADSSIALEPIGTSWVDPLDQDTEPVGKTDWSPRLIWNGDDPPGSASPAVRVTFGQRISVPNEVVSRLWIRTTELPGGDLRSSATFQVRAERGGLTFALPAEASLILVRSGTNVVGAELLPDGGGYHVGLPEAATNPVSVEIEYTVPASASAESWPAPRLLEGAVVQQTLWEVCLNWSRAVLGVPPGWTDANRWYWGGYVWKRRPIFDGRELASWVRRPRTAAIGQTTDDLDNLLYHRYLFSWGGEPSAIRLSIWPRWALVGGCSGLVLAGGMFVILARTNARWVWAAGLVLALLGAVAVEPNTGFQLAQSALIGVLLVLVAGFTHRFVERRRGTVVVPAESSAQGRAPAPSGVDSTLSVPLDVGSDESTVVRRRVPGSEVPVPAPSAVTDPMREK